MKLFLIYHIQELCAENSLAPNFWVLVPFSSDRAILLDKTGLWELFFSVPFIGKPVFGGSLPAQWLGFPAFATFAAVGWGSVPGRGRCYKTYGMAKKKKTKKTHTKKTRILF